MVPTLGCSTYMFGLNFLLYSSMKERQCTSRRNHPETISVFLNSDTWQTLSLAMMDRGSELQLHQPQLLRSQCHVTNGAGRQNAFPLKILSTCDTVSRI